MSPFIIRQHQVGDFGSIISSHGEVYQNEFAFSGEFERNIAEKIVNFYDLIQQDNRSNRIWIADEDSQRAGSIALSRRDNNIGFINFVLVLPECRGQGLARRLMETLIEAAREIGYSKLRLETFTVLVDARMLYEKMGFQIVETTKQQRFDKEIVQEFWELEL